MLHENAPHPWMDHQGSTNYDTPNLKQNFKQWAGANIENPPHPGPSTTKSPTWWSMQPWCGSEPSHLVPQSPTTQNSRPVIIAQNFPKIFLASGLSPPILTPEGLSKTMSPKPPEQWTTSPNRTSVSASEDKYARTSTTIDQVLWYLEGLHQGEPPPKKRWLLRLNKSKRTRIKEDLQGQMSLHGRECCYSCVSFERFREETSMKLRSHIFSLTVHNRRAFIKGNHHQKIDGYLGQMAREPGSKRICKDNCLFTAGMLVLLCPSRGFVKRSR
jgi:hypothetical protein